MFQIVHLILLKFIKSNLYTEILKKKIKNEYNKRRQH